MGVGADGCPDHDECVRVRHGLPQYHGALHLLACREGVLPKASRFKTHDTLQEPARRLDTSSQCLLRFGLARSHTSSGTNDPNAQAYLGLYTLLAILGTMLLLILQAIVSLAIIVYFRMHHSTEAGSFSTLIAPIVAFVAQVYLVYLLVENLETFGGTGASAATFRRSRLRSSSSASSGVLVLRFVAPATYAKIGRMVFTESD